MRRDFDDLCPEAKTLVDVLRARAEDTPHERVYTFLNDGDTNETHLTFGELESRARTIGAALQQTCRPGDRAVLLYPQGLDFITAFYGCMFAGVIPLPAYPPDPSRLQRTLPRFRAIVADAQALVALTTSPLLLGKDMLFAHAPELAALTWLSTDNLPGSGASGWTPPHLDERSLAFIQYTSGSTSTPKGVMISHRNIFGNLTLVRQLARLRPDSRAVSWLPFYHDMGLVLFVLGPVFDGFHSTSMSPVAFLQKPLRWLKTISRLKATYSGAPNFAYDLCARKITEEERETLDLSHWELASSGGEPVQADTLERFSAAFAASGFRPEVFCPAYGMAEMVLGGSALKRREGPPRIHRLEPEALARRQVVESGEATEAHRFVSCGYTDDKHAIAIVDPESRTRCGTGEIGEIWWRGPSVAEGYWSRPEDTELTFGAHLADTGEGPFLRTGDLGFLKDGELCVTGRLKDVIIVGGLNYYPQDIERIVERCHPAMRPGCGAAFSVEVEGEERVVIVSEVAPAVDASAAGAVFAAVRQAVAEAYGLKVHAIALIPPQASLKTSSGKIQRRATRQEFLDRTLPAVATWCDETATPSAARPRSDPPPRSETRPRAPTPAAAPAVSLTEASILAGLRDRLAEHAGVAPEQIAPAEPFSRYGLDSRGAIAFAAAIERWLGIELPPTLAYDYPNLDALSRYVARRLAGEAEVAERLAAPGSEEGPLGQTASDEPIAIIGMSCRFPGASGTAAFWELLCDGIDAIAEVPRERWDIDAPWSADPSRPGGAATRHGGFLGGVDGFDHAFFGISPREAERMDPQQRLLLEVCWEALEDAGQAPSRLAQTPVGVFIGISTNEYGMYQLRDPRFSDPYTGTGSALSIAANRISYLFDFRGPSIAIDTACSSSLVAVHLACRSLWAGEATMALVGGVSLMLSAATTENLSRSGFLAEDGRCRPFDANGKGYVRGEGAGIVVLKPLRRAVADGDRIYAVIRATAMNQDGRSNGLTAPSRKAQEQLLRAVYARAGVSPAAVQYVEAHGTGTPLGDPIEAHALSAVLSPDRPATDPLVVGSVKSNIGHLEAAAGIAGLIKTALALEHRAIPPTIHFQQWNPYIDGGALQLQVQQALAPWPKPYEPLLAGVSSWGFGGTNAHVVLAEAPPRPLRAASGATDPGVWLLPLSARNPEALSALAQGYRRLLQERAPSSEAVTELCYTASARRDHHEHRIAVSGRSPEALGAQLEAYLRDDDSRRGQAAAGKKLVFVFSGHGGEHATMARALFAEEPVFREAIERCDTAFRAHASFSIVAELLADEERSRIEDAEILQPLHFSVQIALAELWRSWGIRPDAVVGHSVGEIAAAYAAGALHIDDAVRIAFHRGRLTQRTKGRGMTAALGITPAEAEAIVAQYGGRLAIASVNSDWSVVLSGDPGALAEVLDRAHSEGRFGRALSANYAFHSDVMDPILDELADALAGITPQHASIPLVSSVTGEPCDGSELGPRYWRDNLRRTVRFAAAIERISADEGGVFVEIGVHPVLSVPLTQCLSGKGGRAILLPSLQRTRGDRDTLLASLGALYTAGHSVDWKALYPEARPIAPLPSYPWQRRRCWLPPEIVPVLQAEREWSTAYDTASGGSPLPSSPPPLLSSALPYGPGEVRFGEAPALEPRVRDALAAAAPSEHRDIAEMYLRRLVAATLALPVSAVAPSVRLDALGFNSLALLELRQRAERDLKLDLPIHLWLNHATLTDLTTYLLEKLRSSSADETSEPLEPSSASVLAAVSSLSSPMAQAPGSTGAPVREGPAVPAIRFKLNKRFVRGSGCFVYDDKGTPYVDAASGDGTHAFGFNSTEIWRSFMSFDALAAGFLPTAEADAEAQLADRLIALAPRSLRYAVFANGGAEAIDTAVRIARMATRRSRVLCLAGSRHAAIFSAVPAAEVLLSAERRSVVPAEHLHVPSGDLDALEGTLEAIGAECAALLIEPVGRGGAMDDLPAGYLERARALCAQHGIRLIFDELDAGLGRAGALMTSDFTQVVPDVLVTGRILGGGFFPFGAVLYGEECRAPELAESHRASATVNPLACRVGLTVLHLLTRGDRALLREAKHHGERLRAGLERLREKYPAWISGVHGHGLMLGLELATGREPLDPRCMLGLIAAEGKLPFVVAGYLLHQERIRVTPPAESSSILRIEPPFILSADLCDRILLGFDRAFSHLEAANAAEMLRYLIDRKGPALLASPSSPPLRERSHPSPQSGDARWALVRYASPQDWREVDPSLSSLEDHELESLVGRLDGLFPPLLAGAGRIRSESGAAAYGECILIPRIPAEAKSPAEVLCEVREAVLLARARGARVVGLDGVAARAARGGEGLADLGVTITTGGSFAADAALDTVRRALAHLGQPMADATVAVLGWETDVGQSIAFRLAKEAGRIVLVSPLDDPEAAVRRGKKMIRDIAQYLGRRYQRTRRVIPGTVAHRLFERGAPQKATGVGLLDAVAALEREQLVSLAEPTDGRLRSATVIVSAIPREEGARSWQHLPTGAVLVDAALSEGPQSKDVRPDILVLDSRRLAAAQGAEPGWPLGMESCPPQSCLAETLLLAFELGDGKANGRGRGDDLEREISVLVRRHGFLLGALERFGQSVSEEDWSRLRLPEATRPSQEVG